MAILENNEIFLLIIVTMFLLCAWLRNKYVKRSTFPTNWPLIGMLPALYQNRHRIHDHVTETLIESGGTFEFKGPWFCNMDMLVTCDPANIHHIFSRKFSNYPKGAEFKKMFEIFGDGMVNVDSELWELHRRKTLSFMGHINSNGSLERVVGDKVETGLFPVLDYFCKHQGTEADLQDIFNRFTFDNISKLLLDYDPCSLQVDFPNIPCEKAFGDATDALLNREVLPESIWKLQKWLKIGHERKLIQAWKAFDEFIYPHVNPFNERATNGYHDFNLWKDFGKAYKELMISTASNYSSDSTIEFLRDTALSLMLAGKDTTSSCLTWLFWLISMNPLAETKIREEIEKEVQPKQDKNWRRFSVEELSKLVYLHGALCESLRLFPPVALEQKHPIQSDILPSGNYIKKNGSVIISFYSTGRMETVWGEDCLEFKPERWISGSGGIKHVPSYKFPVFNAGPRTCLGRDFAFRQMKMVAAAIIYHYNVQIVDDHPVSPRDSVVLKAKHGLRVKLTERNV